MVSISKLMCSYIIQAKFKQCPSSGKLSGTGNLAGSLSRPAQSIMIMMIEQLLRALLRAQDSKIRVYLALRASKAIFPPERPVASDELWRRAQGPGGCYTTR
jgi:hypothetical protein